MGSEKKKVSSKNIRLKHNTNQKSTSEPFVNVEGDSSGQTPQQTQRKPKGVPVKRGDLILPFEKLVLFLLFLFMLAVPFAFLDQFQPMIYVGIIDLLLLGIVFTIKPEMVMQVMRKKSAEKFDKNYGGKLRLLSISLRLYGIGFFVIGAAMVRIMILK